MLAQQAGAYTAWGSGANGIIETIAGNGVYNYNYTGDGGAATSATLSNARGDAVDGGGNLYIADAGNNRIRRVDSVSGVITTVAGNGIYGFADNPVAVFGALHQSEERRAALT